MQCVDIVSRNSRSAAPLAGYARSSTSNETDPQRDRKRESPAQQPLRESLLVAIPSASESLQLPTSSPQPEASVPTLAKPGVSLREFAPPPAHSPTKPLANFAAATPARRPKTNAFALARPPILSAPCIPPVHSPAANRPGTPHEPCSSIAMPPFEACAYAAMRTGALAETPHSRSSHPENVRTNSGEPSPTSHAISVPSSPHASMAKSSGAPARSHENGPCSLRASRTSRAIGSPDASQARANRNAFSLNTMLRRGATSPGMICMNSKFTKRAPQRAAIA